MDAFNIGNLSISQLIDHLQNAVIQEDIIHTVFWLRALSKRGVEDPVMKLHSWRMSSALTTVCVRHYSLTRHFILQLLLSRASKESLESEHGKIALKASMEWSRFTIAGWYLGGKEQAQDAANVLQMRSIDAEEWINKNLPPHPRPESCTRRSALRGPPGASRTSSTPSSLPAPLPIEHASLPISSPISRFSSHIEQASDDQDIHLPTPIRLWIAGFQQELSPAFLQNFTDSLDVNLYDTQAVKGKGHPSLICTVRSKACMDRIIELVEPRGTRDPRVHLALPRQLHLPHFHVLVRNLSERTGIKTLRRWARQSRCGPFEERIGWMGHEVVGLFRVGTAWGADRVARMLAESTVEHYPLTTSWGTGRGPKLSSSPPLTQPLPPYPQSSKQNHARPFGLGPSIYTEQAQTPFERSNAVDSSLSVPDSRSTSASQAASITSNNHSNSLLTPAQTFSNEESDMEISSSASQAEVEPSQSSSSPRTTPSTSIQTISPSPEPLPFALPQPKSKSPVKALSSFPPDSTSAQIVESRMKPLLPPYLPRQPVQYRYSTNELNLPISLQNVSSKESKSENHSCSR